MKIAADLLLPLDVVTEKLAFIGRTGQGKSYAATKLAELMLDAGAQIVALDPTSIWYGLRVNDESLRHRVYVFGGLHGDLPLQPTAGALIADTIVDHGISAVLDVGQWIPSEQQRFAKDFAERFFHRKKAAPSAVHLFLEECQEFVPQNPMGAESATLHEYQRLLKLGRNFGIGASLISQRPQEVSKKALNQSGTLFVFQLTGPQERKAINDWVKDQDIDEDIQALLPKLKRGEPHVWSPTFLHVSKTVQILPKVTGDVSSTPKVGTAVRTRKLSQIDVAQLSTDLAATIERAKADDPKELRKRIAALERELQAKPAPAAEVKTVEVPVLGPAELARLEAGAAALGLVLDRLVGESSTLRGHVNELIAAVAKRDAVAQVKRVEPLPRRPPGQVPQARAISPNGTSPDVGTGGLRRILTALAQRPGGLSFRQIGVRSRMQIRGGSFGTYISRARSNGWVDGDRNLMRITDAGVAALGTYDPPPTGRALYESWLGELGQSGAARILTVLYDAGGRSLAKQEIAERVNMEAGGGSFGTYVSRLRALELIEGRGELKASDELFGEE